jgi:UDP-hydrolysing UDP-N-acetyl-D-glucosamine 2-epimerase
MTRRIVIVTGSRAEFGLLRPVMRAVRDHPGLELAVIAAGSHLVPPGETYREVKAQFGAHIADAVPMQAPGRASRLDDTQAVGAGIARFGRAFERVAPEWVVVLGDRIEAFAAGAAASIGGWALAHVHGGDRAEGIADEAMRHALTKLAHLHFPATPASARRLVRMGEDPASVHPVGSPAIDGLAAVAPMGDEEFAALGAPTAVLLMHPVGRGDDVEEAAAAEALRALEGERLLVLHPNLDAGRAGTLRAIQRWEHTGQATGVSFMPTQGAGGGLGLPEGCGVRTHLPRDTFIALLKRLAASGGVLAGNSSAALIEAAAVGLPAVDIGPRQSGRERCANVVHSADESEASIARALREARAIDRSAITHPYGDGRAGERIAAVLAAADAGTRRKRCSY